MIDDSGIVSSRNFKIYPFYVLEQLGFRIQHLMKENADDEYEKTLNTDENIHAISADRLLEYYEPVENFTFSEYLDGKFISSFPLYKSKKLNYFIAIDFF